MEQICMSGIEGGCTEVAVPSFTFPEETRFCPEHQAELDAIRHELEERAWENNVRNKAEAIEAYCETPGCSYRPVYGGEYCAGCSGE